MAAGASSGDEDDAGEATLDDGAPSAESCSMSQTEVIEPA